MANEKKSAAPQELEGHWVVENGKALESKPGESKWEGDAERLTYNNPFNMELERVWFDGKVVYAAELGELDLDPDKFKVAQEYQIVHQVELDEKGKPKSEPERVPGQFNIYDSVPGMKNYSPLWQFNYVVVPKDFEPNALRSEKDCLDSGYPIFKSKVVEN